MNPNEPIVCTHALYKLTKLQSIVVLSTLKMSMTNYYFWGIVVYYTVGSIDLSLFGALIPAKSALLVY